MCYWTFLYSKIQTLRKKQDNLRYVFIYKNPDTLCYTIFYRIFEIGGGGGAFLYAKNNALFVTFLYAKNNTLCVTFYIQKALHLALHFYVQNKCTLGYVFISKSYRIVLIPTYKRT